MERILCITEKQNSGEYTRTIYWNYLHSSAKRLRSTQSVSYILKMNDFNQVSQTPLEEWIYYLNTGEIPDQAQAPGLNAARERLKLDRMSKDELKAYYRHLDNIVILRDNINTERAEGRAEGLEAGRQEEHRQNAIRMKAKGFPTQDIADITGLSPEEIDRL